MQEIRNNRVQLSGIDGSRDVAGIQLWGTKGGHCGPVTLEEIDRRENFSR